MRRQWERNVGLDFEPCRWAQDLFLVRCVLWVLPLLDGFVSQWLCLPLASRRSGSGDNGAPDQQSGQAGVGASGGEEKAVWHCGLGREH